MKEPQSRAEPLTTTVNEAARMLGISRNAAYEAARRGELPVIRIGKRVLERAIEQCRAQGAESMLVSWTPGRGSPEPMYLQRGFLPTGEVVDGEIEARLRLA